MTAWSGLFNREFTDGHSLLVNRHPALRVINIMFRRSRTGLRSANVAIHAAIDAASGVNPGAVTYKRVQAVVDPGEAVVGGGTRTIETRTLRASGNISTAEETRLKNIFVQDAKPATYPVDKSGNTGGGRTPGSI